MTKGRERAKGEPHFDSGPSIGRFVPFSAHVDDRTLKTRDGDYLRVWSVRGIPFETSTPIEIGTRHEALNQLIRALGDGEMAFWSHKLRRRIRTNETKEFNNAFASAVAGRYQAMLDAKRLLVNELYLTVVYRARDNILSHLPQIRSSATLEEFTASEQRAVSRMEEISLQIESGLAKYGASPLTTYSNNGVTSSRILEFLGLLVNGHWEAMPLPNGPIFESLANVRLLFGTERIEIRAPEETRFGAILDLKDYPDWSEPGTLDPLLYSDCEFVETQSFSPLSASDAQSYLRRQRNRLLTSNDAAKSQVEALDDALDQLVGGTFVFGEFHFSLAILGHSLPEVARGVAEARVTLLEQGFQSAVVDLVPDAAWFAQLPSNWRWRTRLARLSSRNFCAMSPFHNFLAGKPEGNPWGPAVCLFTTPSGGPLYFSFHVSEDGEDAFDRKMPGNTMIIGQTGSGKTVTELFLVTQSLKFCPKVVIFDKDRGAEIAVRAMGGQYLMLRSGEPTGLNPFQLDPSDAGFVFWEAFVRRLLQMEGVVPTPSEVSDISHAIRTIARFPREKRGLSTLRQNLVGENTQRVCLALARWCEGGPLAWVFDNPSHDLDFAFSPIVGIDYTDLLETPEVRTPLVMLLLHLVETALDGSRFIYVLAEFWKALDDPVFSDFVRNKQKTIRKQNGIGIFDTQSPMDVLASPIARTLIEQTATFIFLPNPRADREDYVNGFKLTEEEFEIIRRLGEASHTFLIKQNGQSCLARLDLSELGEVLEVLSATTDNLQVLDDVRQEWGDRPDIWLPMFWAKVSHRRGIGLAKRAV